MAMRLLMVLCAGGLWYGAALADCTPRDRQDMKEGGMNEVRIRHFCNATEHRARGMVEAESPSRQSNICQTQLTSCALNRVGAVGATCWCNTASGPARGRLAAE